MRFARSTFAVPFLVVVLMSGCDRISQDATEHELIGPSAAPVLPELRLLPSVWDLDRFRWVIVYVLTDPDFDATTIDAEDIHLRIDNGSPVPVARPSRSPLTRDLDVDEDGDLDRYFGFATADLRAAGLSSSSAIVSLNYRDISVSVPRPDLGPITLPRSR